MTLAHSPTLTLTFSLTLTRTLTVTLTLTLIPTLSLTLSRSLGAYEHKQRILHAVPDTFKTDPLHFDFQIQPREPESEEESDEEFEYDPACEPWQWPLRMALATDDVARFDAIMSHYPDILEFYRETPEEAQLIQQAARFGANGILLRMCAEHGRECQMDTYYHPILTGESWLMCRGQCIGRTPSMGHFCHSFRCYEGDTPLMQAALMGQVRTVRYLLDLGADIDQRNKWGNTALSNLFNYHVAASRHGDDRSGHGAFSCPPVGGALTTNDCQLAVICLLLSRGASLECAATNDTRNEHAQYGSVVEMARARGNAPMAEYMLSPGSRDYPGISARLDVSSRHSFANACALMRREHRPRALGRLPPELVQKIANVLPPLPEPTKEEVNEAFRAVPLAEHRGRVLPMWPE